jgi:hypothetical protein
MLLFNTKLKIPKKTGGFLSKDDRVCQKQDQAQIIVSITAIK